jgi:hypothetical protein
MMRAKTCGPLVALFTLVTLGCSDMILVPGTVDPFVGQWTTVRLQHASVADPARVRDLAAEGWRLETNITPVGQFTATLFDPEGLATTETGSVVANGGSLAFAPTGVPGLAAELFELQTVTPGAIVMTAQTQFAFDGVEVLPSVLTLELRPRNGAGM